jgi:5-enolpyruvylshikimate-3-phosphate synthase
MGGALSKAKPRCPGSLGRWRSRGRRAAGRRHVGSRLGQRIATGFAVAGLRRDQPVTVGDMTPVPTSRPGFTGALEALLPA